MRRRAADHWDPVAPTVTGLVRPVRLDPAGVDGPTKGQAEGPYWERSSHGWHVPSTAPRELVEQRILEASVLLPEHGAVTAWAACRLLGAAYFDGVTADGDVLPVPLAIGPHRSLGASRVAVPTNNVLLTRDRTTAYDVPVAVAARALYDAVRLAPSLVDAVRAIDMMAAADLCSLQMLDEYAEEQPQDARRVRAALALASEHAWSPIEVDLRLACHLRVGLSDLVPNADIFDSDGRQVATVDLLDVPAGAAYEADGDHHGRRRGPDQRRTDILVALGLELARFTGREARRPGLVEARVRATRERSRFEPHADRRWYHRPQPDVLHQRLTSPQPRAS